MKAIVFLAVGLGLIASAAPAAAQDVDPGQVLSRVCLPYATRSASFEKAIRLARDLDFQRPAGAPALEEWSSDVELMSRDGIWRIKLEEGTITEGETDVYSVSCTIWSSRASATELSRLIDRALSGDARWTQGDTVRWRRDRPSSDSSLLIDIKEQEGRRPTLSATGIYR